MSEDILKHTHTEADQPAATPQPTGVQPQSGGQAHCPHCTGQCNVCSSGAKCSNCAWGDDKLRGIAACGCGRSDHQLNTFDYLADVPGNNRATDFVEVQFKNTRKGFYRNDNHLELVKGDIVAVEAQPGHDIGVVTLTGKLVMLQMQKANLRQGVEVKRVYRKARPTDMEIYEQAKAREHETMIRSRQIAKDLELQMKIGDVEYQGDGNKAIFYYIADQRVDFRKLIKVLAEAFHVRIEMKQIGARQEAGRIGGIGPCGRELCCATWMKNFSSVSTAAARFQDITPNPQKLAGQCAKLKCCLNYEVDVYIEAAKALPPRNAQLETADSTYYFFKADTLAGLVTYSTDRRMAVNLVTISTARAQEVMQLNAAGEKPLTLDSNVPAEPERSHDLAEQDDLTRFDKTQRKNNRSERRQRKAERQQNNAQKDKAEAQSQKSNRRKDNFGREDNRNDKDKKNSSNERQARRDRRDRPTKPSNNAEDKEKNKADNRRERKNRVPRPPRENKEGNGSNEA